MTGSDTLDVVDLLTRDHRVVEELFARIEGLTGLPDDGSRAELHGLVEQVTIELVKHSVAEEVAVYPKIAAKIDKTEAARLVQEQAEAEVTMKALEALHPGDPQFDIRLTDLISQIRAHVAEEEAAAFPQIRRTFTPDELVAMGKEVTTVKAVAPTRPHPAAPDTPPGNILLGPVTGLFDRLRDTLTHRGA